MAGGNTGTLAKKKVIKWAAAVGWSLGLVFLAVWSLPGPEVLVFSLVDKVKHAAAYGALGLLWAAALFAVSRRPRWLLALAAGTYAFAWGALTEAAQLVTPGRQADLSDLAADAVGVVVCITAYWWANPDKGQGPV